MRLPANCRRVNQAPTTVRNQCHRPEPAASLPASLAPRAPWSSCVFARLGSVLLVGREAGAQPGKHTRGPFESVPLSALTALCSPYLSPTPTFLCHSLAARRRPAGGARRVPSLLRRTHKAEYGRCGCLCCHGQLLLPLLPRCGCRCGLAAAAASRARSWPQLCTTGGDQEQGLEKLSNDNRHVASPAFES